jgi:outer membrane receptor for ferrienterochelin and colicin
MHCSLNIPALLATCFARSANVQIVPAFSAKHIGSLSCTICLLLMPKFAVAQGDLTNQEAVVNTPVGAAIESSAPAEGVRNVDPGATDSTVVYEAEFFSQYNPITASDMLDRIPGVNVGGGNGGGRGLGTGGNLLINGQRIAGKGNTAGDQLDRITAAEVERIEIIRDTSGALNVRGAGEVINIILTEVPSRSSTQVQLLQRLNHDNTYEVGGNIGWSAQAGNFQTLLNVESRPNYENRDNREVRITPADELLGTLFEENIRDQDVQSLSSNVSYSFGPHRMQLNAQLSQGDFPRAIRRDFTDIINGVTIDSVEQEHNSNEESNWELGGDYEYSFENGSRLAVLFVANDEVRNSIRERFVADPADQPFGKNLFIDSQNERKEFIVQTNYNFNLTKGQSLRVGFERAITELDSALFIATPSSTQPPSKEFGSLSLNESTSNAGTQVEEVRYEGFAFHNWTFNSKSSLESSLVYETSEISQSGAVNKTRGFQFWRPSFDYRYNFADNFRFRGTVRRNVSQLSFSSFAATTNNDDRDIDGFAGNPELEPETSWSYEGELEYRLPNDAGVIATSIFYTDTDNNIGRINATVDPDQPQSATGNVGPAKQYGWFTRASLRLNWLNLPNAIVSSRLGLFDSEILNPFINQKIRTGGRGFANIDFRHDITSLNLSYGIEYNHSVWGGFYDVDIITRTRNDRRRSLDLFVQKIWFDDWVFRLESDNTLGASRCRYRERFETTTIAGDIALIQDSCSSRYRRLIFSIQTTF